MSESQIRLGIDMDVATLFPGDIIATSTAAKTSSLIRWSTNGVFSHGIIYVGQGLGVEALPNDGVVKGPLVDALKATKVAKVFRHRTATEEETRHAAKWAAAQAGKPYDYTGAARIALQKGARGRVLRYTTPGLMISIKDEYSAFKSDEGHDATFFCSELIARAFQVAGAPIVNTQVHLTGPGKFLHTNKLVLMGKLGGVS